MTPSPIFGNEVTKVVFSASERKSFTSGYPAERLLPNALACRLWSALFARISYPGQMYHPVQNDRIQYPMSCIPH